MSPSPGPVPEFRARAGRARWLICVALAWVIAGASALPAAAAEKPPGKGTPTLIVAGKYRVNNSSVRSVDELLELVLWLVDHP